MTSPEKFRAFLSAHQFNLILVKNTEMTQQTNPFFPVGEWAKVFQDPVAVVYVRRIPENLTIIQKNEQKNEKP